MDFYSILVFLHVLGAVGVFAAWGIEAVAVGRLRQAVTADQARTSIALLGKALPTGPVAMLTTLFTGMWMMWARWGHQPWMITAFVGLVAIVAVGLALERRARPLLVAAAEDGPERVPAAAAAGEGGRILAASLRTRVAIGIAILGLMTAKPGMAASLTILATGVVIGLGTAVGSSRRGVPAGAASRQTTS